MIKTLSPPTMLEARMAGDWTDEQNDAIVADYFAMSSTTSPGAPTARPSITVCCKR